MYTAERFPHGVFMGTLILHPFIRVPLLWPAAFRQSMESCGQPLSLCLFHPSLLQHIFLGSRTHADLSPKKFLYSIINIYAWPGPTYRPLLQKFWMLEAEEDGGKRKGEREGERRIEEDREETEEQGPSL